MDIKEEKEDFKDFSLNFSPDQEEHHHEIVQFVIEELEETYRCTQCTKEFPSAALLQLHMPLHSVEAPFQCTSCPKSFITRTRLYNHGKVHRQHQNLPCITCGKVFKSPALLTKHKKIHNPERKFQCAHCEKKFKTKFELKCHILQVHFGFKKHKVNTQMFFCELCGGIFATNRDCRHHKKTVHGEYKRIHCDLCSLEVETNVALKKHIKEVHRAEEFHLRCRICHQSFAKKKLFRKHLMTHIQKPKKCFYCDRVLKDRMKLEGHIQEKHRGLPMKLSDGAVSCGICDEKLQNIILLQQHVAEVHPNEGFSCSICQKKLRTRITLRKHLKTVHGM